MHVPYASTTTLLIIFSSSKQGSIEMVEMSLKFFACTVICHKSKAVSPDHLHLIMIGSSNVAYWLGVFEPQSRWAKFSDICYEIQIGIVPFLCGDTQQQQAVM